MEDEFDGYPAGLGDLLREHEQRLCEDFPDAVEGNPRTCREAGCTRRAVCRGYCNRCYQRAWREGVIRRLWDSEPEPEAHEGCDVEGCEKPHRAHGLCGMHLRRFERHGNPNTKLKSGPKASRLCE